MSRGLAAAIEPLAAYSVDVRTGFVPACAPLERLPAAYDAWEGIVPELSASLRSLRIRKVLATLPALDALELRSDRERERALLLLTVFGNAWVWGGREPDLRIPQQVAIPLCALAAALDRPPIVHYASMALNNWRLLDPQDAFSADNARMQVQFLGGVDEDWFFMGSLGVELAGAPLLPLVHAACGASHRESDDELADYLERIAQGMLPVRQALERLREWCDPYVFYYRVRRYISGWPEPGVVYAGVSNEPQKYVGGSAAQSSLLQVLDSLLAIDHVGSITGPYLKAVRRYMPVAHRRFVTDVERCSAVRARAQRGSTRLAAAYNEAVEQMSLFRSQHIKLAHDYIIVPSGAERADKGTGGTTLVDFLQSAHAETARTKLR